MTHQCRTDSSPLVLIDHSEGHFGLASLHDDITSSPNDHGSAAFFHPGHQSDMVHEVDVQEERYFLSKNSVLWQETAVEGLPWRGRRPR